MIEYVAIVKFILTFAAVAVLICRIAKMTHKTRRYVRYQHILLCGSLFFSLTVPPDLANIVLCVGVLVYFCYSKRRWGDSAPHGTIHPIYMQQTARQDASGNIDG